MSFYNQSFLYNQASEQVVKECNGPSFNPGNTTEIKLTPMGKSPENVEASQVKSINQELAGNSSL
jgi:hypothetical protein